MLYGGFYGRSTYGGIFRGIVGGIIERTTRKVGVLLRTVGSKIQLLTKTRKSPLLTQRNDRTVL